MSKAPQLLRCGAPPYLQSHIANGAAVASLVRLRMHGEIRLKQRWTPFVAEEVLDRDRGFVWTAKAGMISGSDTLVSGIGRCVWKLWGLLPVMKASGPDIDRSAVGRFLAESLFLPSMLLPEAGAVWEDSRVTLSKFGESAEIELGLDGFNRLQGFRLRRWGNPDGAPFGYHFFGGVVEEERFFGGYTIPSRLRLGWHLGTHAWSAGQFLRLIVDEAVFS